MISQTVSMLEAYHVRKHDRIVITAGVPFGSDGQTNLIQVHELD